MSIINNIIGMANFEIVRSKIASILSDELANQKTLNETELAIEEAKPTPDPELIALYNANLNAIPDRVYDERFKRPIPEEYKDKPLINVVFQTAPLNELQTISTQIGDNTYVIEFYTGEFEPDDGNPINTGDSLATFKLQRIIGICRSILMNPNYQRLGFDITPIVTKVSANNIQISQPDDGVDNSDNLIYGRFVLTVKVAEDVEQVTGVPLAQNGTTLRFYDTDKGYYWTNESN